MSWSTVLLLKYPTAYVGTPAGYNIIMIIGKCNDIVIPFLDCKLCCVLQRRSGKPRSSAADLALDDATDEAAALFLEGPDGNIP